MLAFRVWWGWAETIVFLIVLQWSLASLSCAVYTVRSRGARFSCQAIEDRRDVHTLRHVIHLLVQDLEAIAQVLCQSRIHKHDAVLKRGFDELSSERGIATVRQLSPSEIALAATASRV